MTVSVLDLAYAAYEAGLRRDMAAELRALTSIVRAGRSAVDVAMRAWIDRTHIVMHAVAQQENTRIGADLDIEDSATGDDIPIDGAPTEAAWAARMFMAHTRDDADRWESLWSTVPTDPNQITNHVTTLLHSMVATAEQYERQNQPELACCPEHANPMLAAARAAMAHYN